MLRSLEEQLQEITAQYPAAVITKNPDGSIYVEIPNMKLPGGWNKPSTNILLHVPVGYPTARPNGFEADADLRLAAGGGVPQGSGQATHLGRPWLHFCWQPAQAWDNGRDALWKHIEFAFRRFRDEVR